MMTEVPGGQPLALPKAVFDNINGITTFLQEARNNAGRLAKQDKTMRALEAIESLGKM